MNTHGDYSIQQLIYNEGKLATVIDFETAKKMPIVWEIVRSYSYVDKNAEDGKIDTDNLIQYFKEVSKYVELNQYGERKFPDKKISGEDNPRIIGKVVAAFTPIEINNIF